MSPDLVTLVQSKAARKVAFFFAQFCAVLGVVLWFSVAAAETWRVRVDFVLDGDTVVLETDERLRLRGIDAPEVKHGDRSGQYYGRESKAMLRDLTHGRDVFLDRDELDRDRYGRLVGIARLGDGRVVNMVLVEEGAAFVYPHSSDGDPEFDARLVEAQRLAMARGAGFWPRILDLPAASKRYIGTKSSRRFHTMGCAKGRIISARNRVEFSSLQEAFAAGFAPARGCTPWPSARKGK